MDNEEDQQNIDERSDELTGRGFAPDEIAEMERRAIDNGEDADKISDPRSRESSPTVDEDDAVRQRLRDYYSEDNGRATTKRKMFGKGSLSRKLGFATVAVGVPSLLAGIAFLPGLLGLFKIQNFFENTNASTFLRLNAAFDNRSDKWLKAYIKLRLTEIDGEVSPGQDTLYFRANKVDTDNPIRDWYRTLRTSNFERDLFEKEGISFKSSMTKDANGRVTFGLGVVKIRDVPLNATSADIGTSFDLADTGASADVMNRIGKDLDRFVDVEVISGAGSGKQARRAIKDAVNRNTSSWQVFQRRKIRKDIANMTGVRSWRLFETTRDRIDAKKKSLFDKIMINVLPENRVGKFVACLFGAGNCPSATDPGSSDSRNASTLGDTSRVSADDSPTETVNPDQVTNPDGTYETATDLTPGSAANEISDAAKTAAASTADGVTEVAAKRELGKQIRDMVGKYLGNPYTKIWAYLKKLAKLHDVFSNNKIGKLVVQGRRAQYMAAYATMAIAVSQMKSGDIAGTELLPEPNEQASGIGGFAETISNAIALRNSETNQYMRYFDNAERSEAWMLYGGGRADAISKVNAEGEDQGRDDYCDMSEADQKLQPIYYQCYDDGLNGNNAEEMSDAYNNSIGKLLGPIAEAVKSVDNSVFGKVFNWFDSVADKIVDKVVGPILNWVLETTGAGAKIEDVVTTGVVKAMEYAGAGVKYEPTLAGQMNYIMMGGAATAEATARNNGAAATSSYAYLRDYSNKMASDWQKEKESNESAWDRYASLSNPKSIASSMVMNISTSTPSTSLRTILNPIRGLDTYANVLGNSTYAQEEATPSSVAEWSGLVTYDFPKECYDLDPLEPNYFEKATNAPAGVTRNMATLGDSSVFWDAVYANLGGTPEEKEAEAAAIYNCVLLDRSVMGGIGYVYGYTDDGGFNSSASTDEGANSDEGGSTTIGSLTGPTIPCEGQSRVLKKLGWGVDWSGVTPTGSIGKNSAGQDINVYIRSACAGQTNVRTIVVGATIHAGGESSGQIVAHDLLFNKRLPPDVRVIAIPVINGAGFTGQSPVSRVNKNGVNLNRNFDYRWEDARPSEPDMDNIDKFKGSSAASEPETQAIQNFLLDLGKTNLVLSYHSPTDRVLASGPNRSASSTISRRYSQLTNQMYSSEYGYGFFEAWYNDKTDTPAVLVEMSGEKTLEYINAHTDAVVKILEEGIVK